MPAVNDPRTIITPDAFEVSPDLLGLPLAPPARRLGAILADVILVGIVTVVMGDLGLIVGLLAAILFIRVASRRTGKGGTALAWAFRLSVGCLGMGIFLVTALVFFLVRDGDDGPSVDFAVGGEEDGRRVASLRLADLIAGAGSVAALRQATSPAMAEEALVELGRRARGTGITEEDELEALLEELAAELVPSEAWTAEEDIDGVVDRAVARVLGDAGSPPDPGEDPQPVPELAPAEALEAYAALLREEGVDEDDPELTRLRPLALRAVAADTLETLHERLDELRTANQDLVDEVRNAVEEVEQAEAGAGFLGWVRELVDDLGLAFGWGSVYFAVLMPYLEGRTPGKRLFGLRVLRLDGEPISWWHAFERAGGYAAGFATGLLGFAQIYWDPNRQAIHDKIAGTVVVLDGAPRAPGNWYRTVPGRPTPFGSRPTTPQEEPGA